MAQILIVEDDNDINQAVTKFLTQQGAQIRQAYSGTEGILLWKMYSPDLIIADLMLPGISGEDFLREIRKESSVPVIVLSARDGLADKVNLLGIGADDYLSKPFEMEELWARIQVQLRRQNREVDHSQNLRFGQWRLDMEERTLYACGQPVPLTRHEFDIAELLVRRPKKVFTKQEIYEAVWNQDYFVEDKTINVHISNIRSKLKESGADDYIQTVWGIGFKMCSDQRL